MKHLLFATSEEDLDKMTEKYEKRVPKPLNSQFIHKVPRDEAITKNAARKRKIAELYPSGIYIFIVFAGILKNCYYSIGLQCARLLLCDLCLRPDNCTVNIYI